MARNRENKIELTAYDDLFETDESHAEANLSKIREMWYYSLGRISDGAGSQSIV